MGIIAVTAAKSWHNNGVRSFNDQIESVPRTFFKYQQPRTPEYVSLLDRARILGENMKSNAEAQNQAGFGDRTQLGFPVWAGAPGLPETRPIKQTAEAPTGDVFNALA